MNGESGRFEKNTPLVGKPNFTIWATLGLQISVGLWPLTIYSLIEAEEELLT